MRAYVLCVCVRVSACESEFACVSGFVSVCTHVCVPKCVRVCVRTCVCVYARVCV